MLALEIAAIAAAALASWKWPLYALIGLLVAGSLARWSRGKGWTEARADVHGLTVLAASLGLLALALALALASPFLERLTARSIEWTQLAVVRGNVTMLGFAAMLIAAQVVAYELILRRWIVDRVVELGARPLVAVAAAAAVELAIAGANPAARLGAGLAGLGYGLLYLGAGRRLAAPLAARLVFELGALVLIYARWV